MGDTRSRVFTSRPSGSEASQQPSPPGQVAKDEDSGENEAEGDEGKGSSVGSPGAQYVLKTLTMTSISC